MPVYGEQLTRSLCRWAPRGATEGWWTGDWTPGPHHSFYRSSRVSFTLCRHVEGLVYRVSLFLYALGRGFEEHLSITLQNIYNSLFCVSCLSTGSVSHPLHSSFVGHSFAHYSGWPIILLSTRYGHILLKEAF
jgi:hypothetical protein